MELAEKEFLQAMMSYGIMEGRQVKAVINDIIRRHEVETDFASYIPSVVAAINQHVEPFDMQIKKCVCEIRGTNYYALINQTEHPLNRFSPRYSPPQLELFKRIVEEAVSSETGSVSSVDVLNFDLGIVGKFSRKDREDTLSKMEADKWLVQDRGDVSLGVRSISELDVYIREAHRDVVKMCHGCNALVIRGQRCDSCDVRIHNHCAKKLFKSGTQPKCPRCKAPWTTPAEETPASQGPTQTTPRETKPASDEEAASQMPPPSAPGARRSRRLEAEH